MKTPTVPNVVILLANQVSTEYHDLIVFVVSYKLPPHMIDHHSGVRRQNNKSSPNLIHLVCRLHVIIRQ